MLIGCDVVNQGLESRVRDGNRVDSWSDCWFGNVATGYMEVLIPIQDLLNFLWGQSNKL